MQDDSTKLHLPIRSLFRRMNELDEGVKKLAAAPRMRRLQAGVTS